MVAVARTVGGLEELDDKIKAAGGTATLVPLDLKDYDGIARLAAALNERYGRLDVLVGNAGILGALSPLGHVEPKAWDDVIAVNVTANWQLIRAFDPLLEASRCRPRGVRHLGRWRGWRGAYWGPYAVSKAALERAWRAPMRPKARSTNVRVNLFNPGPTRTRMMATALPGVDPMTLPTPEEVAKTLVPLCLPDCTENGRLYDFRAGKFLSFQPPA